MDEPQDNVVFKSYPHLAETEGLEMAILESLSPDYRMLLHNMRTQAVIIKLSLDPESSDFRTTWSQLTGQISVLTTLINE